MLRVDLTRQAQGVAQTEKGAALCSLFFLSSLSSSPFALISPSCPSSPRPRLLNDRRGAFRLLHYLRARVSHAASPTLRFKVGKDLGLFFFFVHFFHSFVWCSFIPFIVWFIPSVHLCCSWFRVFLFCVRAFFLSFVFVLFSFLCFVCSFCFARLFFVLFACFVLLVLFCSFCFARFVLLVLFCSFCLLVFLLWPKSELPPASPASSYPPSSASRGYVPRFCCLDMKAVCGIYYGFTTAARCNKCCFAKVEVSLGGSLEHYMTLQGKSSC